MGSFGRTEWCRLLDDSISWLPKPIRDEIEHESDSSQWSDPVEAYSFLKIILSIKEAELSMAMSLIEKVYETSQYEGALFLLRARVHFLLGEYEDMMSCLKHAADLNEDPVQVEQTTAELAALLNRLAGQREGLESDVELNADCLVEPIDEGQIQIDSTSGKGSSLKLSKHSTGEIRDKRTSRQLGPKFRGINICLVGPSDYDYIECLRPIVDNLAFEFGAAGYDVIESRNTALETHVNLVIGWHLLSRDQLFAWPTNTIFYNFEQMDNANRGLRELFIELSSNYECWDYSLKNIEIFGGNNIRHIPYGTSPCSINWNYLSNKNLERDIDILFVGSLNDRRLRLLQSLIKLGLVVKVLTKTFGTDLETWIGRAKIVLNIHFYDSAILEVARLNYMLGKGVVLVSEYQGAPDRAYEDLVVFAEYDDLCHACCEVLENPKLREEKLRNSLIFLLKKQSRFAFRSPAFFTESLIQLCDQSCNEPRATVVIPVFNNPLITKQCIESLLSLREETSFCVLVIDDASDIDTQRYLESLGDSVNVIRNEQNIGYLLSCNIAFSHVDTEYTVLLNNDTILHPCWLDEMVKIVDQNPKIGAVGSTLFYETGELQEIGSLVFCDGSGWNFGKGDRSFAVDDYCDPIPVDYCSAASLLVRTDLLTMIGGFDEQFAPAYYEDTDLCFSIREWGFEVVCAPKSRLIHIEGGTNGSDLGSGHKAYQLANQPKFVEKWADVLVDHRKPPRSPAEFPKSSNRNFEHHLDGDRAMDKSRPLRLLVIDAFVPFYDRASGSKRMFEILKIAAKMGVEITFVARNGYLANEYVDSLMSLGVKEFYAGDVVSLSKLDIDVGESKPFDFTEILNKGAFDVAWLSFYYVAEQYMGLIRQFSPKTKIIVDSVDIHYLREERQAALVSDPKAINKAAITRIREKAAYQAADCVIAITDPEAQLLKSSLGVHETAVIPNIHQISTELPRFESQQKKILFVGNFNHTPNIDAVVYFLNEIFPLVKKEVPESIFEIVGNNPPAQIVNLERISGVEVLGWVPDLAPVFLGAQVSVAPLRFGAGMKGKIGEALASGLPCVTTTIGAEGMGLINGVHARIEDDPSLFSRAVIDLFCDRAAWEEIQENGLRLIDQKYSENSVAWLVRNVLDTVQA